MLFTKTDILHETDTEIDPGFNAGFFERLIAFIKELLQKISVFFRFSR